MILHKWLLLSVINNINKAEQPFDTKSGNHINYLDHKFYDVYFFENNETILDEIKLTNNPNAIIHQNLSNSDDVPEIRFDLDWDFTFYGHLHNWLSVSPNGFLTTHPVTCWSFCNWWYETSSYRRYMAPMMADFNPSKYDESHVLYYINDTEQSFNVEWHNLTLWQPTNSTFLGYKFDFQIKLKSDGTIFFYYFNIPKSPQNIQVPSYLHLNYSVLIGLEDAAYKHSNDGLYHLYPYAPVDINQSHILNHHTIVFKPKETCIDQTSCTQCRALATDPGSNLECGWCPTLGLCSDGMGREIYEYTSSDYCTDNEMLTDLASETCIDYVIDTRICREHDHVLARFPTEMVHQGLSKLYSGVIISLNSDSNTYLIRYDNESMLDSMVQYSWIHPCSTVSYDYSSYDLPPHCVPHCNSSKFVHNNNTDTPEIFNITVRKHNDATSKSKEILKAIGLALAVLVVVCAIIQLFFYRGRRRRREMRDTQNIIINQATRRGIQLGDQDDDEDEEIDSDHDNTIVYHERTMSLDDLHLRRVSHPIISDVDTDTKVYTRRASSVDIEIEEQAHGLVEIELGSTVINDHDDNMNNNRDHDGLIKPKKDGI